MYLSGRQARLYDEGGLHEIASLATKNMEFPYSLGSGEIKKILIGCKKDK